MPRDFSDMTSEEIAATKAQLMADTLAPLLPLDYGSRVAVTIWEASFDGSMLVVRATASAYGMPVPSDSIYYFINPPLNVLDANGDPVEDILGAAQEMILDAIVLYARQHGVDL